MATAADLRATYGVSLAFVPNRQEFPVLLNERSLFGCGVEIGVQQGFFSEHLLRHWKGLHLISIDPWMTEETESYVDIANVDQGEHENRYQSTLRRLAPFGRRSSTWRMTSLDAAERIPGHCLDFAYIDARHDYDSVLEDLEAWFDKVRPGGILAGHDYVDGKGECGVFGVKSAVDTFFAARGLSVQATLDDAPWPTWMVEIPRPDERIAAPALEGLEARSATPTPVLQSAPTPLPSTAMAPSPAAAAGAKRDVSLTLNLAAGPRKMNLRLDESLMSQRMMLECFDQNMLYEEETSQFMVTVLRPGDSFVDIGTHVGYFSMLAATLVGPEGTVISFEPELRNFRQLIDHIDLNGFENVAPINAAVGAQTGKVDFHINTDNDGGHALWEVGLHPFNEKSRSEPLTRTVDVVSLDSFLRDLGVFPRVVKIDVEGAEHSVLLGARETLSQRPIPFIVAEINRFGLEKMGTTEQAVRRYMTDLGYETYAFDPEGGRIVRLGDGDSVESDYVFNLVFRHPVAAAA